MTARLGLRCRSTFALLWNGRWRSSGSRTTTPFSTFDPCLKRRTDPDCSSLPGIEITTHQGHLLALFSPNRLNELEGLAAGLKLQADPLDGHLRSPRSILELVGEIHDRQGLAIPAHVDAADGISARLAGSELGQLLAHPGLSGLEFHAEENLSWFSDADMDPVRATAWAARKANSDLSYRGLARIMSSDAHSPDQVGKDRSRRTLTRLRIDEANFTAVANAVVNNSRARCKVEADLPPNYPRILEAWFEGGFLDGVHIEFSDNLTCFIGGRGSGKSTALIAMCACLGATLAPHESPDEPNRMPDRTRVRFIDRLGNERIAARDRGMPAPTSGGERCRENNPDRSRFTITGQGRSMFKAGDGTLTESRVTLYANAGQAALSFEATNNRANLRCMRDGIQSWLKGKGWKPRVLYAKLQREPAIGSKTAIYVVGYVITLSDGTRYEYPVELLNFQTGRAIGSHQYTLVFSPDGSRPCECELDEARLVSSRLART